MKNLGDLRPHFSGAPTVVRLDFTRISVGWTHSPWHMGNANKIFVHKRNQ